MTKRDRAVKYFAKGLSTDEVAALLKSPEWSVKKFLRDDDFHDAIHQHLLDLGKQGAAIVATALPGALRFIIDCVNDEDLDIKVRLTYADKLVGYHYRNVEPEAIRREIERYNHELGSIDNDGAQE